MNLPSLPTDNLNKFFLFAGLVILIYVFFLDSNYKKLDDITQETVNLQIEEDKQIAILNQAEIDQKSKFDEIDTFYSDFNKFVDKVSKGYVPSSIELERYLNKDREYTNLMPVLKQKTLEYRLNSIELSAKVKALTEKFEKVSKEQKSNSGFVWTGFILFFCGLSVWYIDQFRTDKIFKNQYQKAVNEHISDTCQSCGMDLRYTVEIHKGRYCDYCFGADNFRLPDATLEEFRTLIKDRMKELKATEKHIQRHLKSLDKLDRWKDVFRWQ